MDFDHYAGLIHGYNIQAGWWADPTLDTVFDKLQLVITEVSEATEGERKSLMDNHLPHRKMPEVELADTLIRVLDLAGRLGLWHVSGMPHYKYCAPAYSVCRQHLGINICVVELALLITSPPALTSVLALSYSKLVNSIAKVAENGGYDLEQAMLEKLEYNKTRADHSLAARQAKHGKKF